METGSRIDNEARTALMELGRLFALARDRRPEARSDLASAVSDLLSQPLSATERALVVDILVQLTRTAELIVRQSLAERLAEDSNAPNALIELLANDEITVARPVLALSEVLTDADLVQVIRDRGVAHHRAIAERPSVSELVSDALFDGCDTETIKLLLENDGADISQAALHRASALARKTTQLQSPLLGRHELPSSMAVDLYWYVSLELRRFILNRYDLQPETVDRALESTIQELIDGSTAPLRVTEELDDLAARLAATDRIDGSLLVRALRRHQHQLFITLMARAAHLPADLIRQILIFGRGEPLAMICRSMNIDKPTFASIFLLSRSARRGDHVVDPRELGQILSYFDRLNRDTARAATARWRKDPKAVAVLMQ